MISNVFKYELEPQDRVQLFNGCYTIASFLKKIRATRSVNKEFCEHGFQSLVEAIIQYRGLLDNYVSTPTHEALECKIHGVGNNSEGRPSPVGVFYVERDNEHQPLTDKKNYVTTFTDSAQRHHNTERHAKTLHLFSNAPSIHDNTKKQFIEMQGLNDAVVLYMREDIANLVDGDEEFWEFFKQSLRRELKPIPQKLLRDFQKQAVKAFRGKKKIEKGQLILPTATGKTLIEAALIADVIVNWTIIGEIPVCIICSPRIVLSYQHLNEISEFLISRNIVAEYMCLNSGAYQEEQIKHRMMQQGMLASDVPSTTSPEILRKKYAECRFSGIPLIIASTYQSLPRLLNAHFPKVALKIADEAHNLVGGRFATEDKKNFHKVPAEQTIYATASPEHNRGEAGNGMQNTKIFGKVIFTRTPKQMIEEGEIVPPFIHQVRIDKGVLRKHNNNIEIPDCNDINNVEVDNIVIMECFEELKKTHYEHSADPDQMGTKMLVTFKTQDTFDYFFTSPKARKWAKDNNVQLMGMTSESGAYIDNKYFPATTNFKAEFGLALDESTPEGIKRQLIIGHIDMIGEGINVPTLLGVLPLRDLGDIKALQTIGRTMRLFYTDRADFYSGKTKAGERKKMIKPYAWVITPYYTWEHQDGSRRIADIAERMRDDYGYNPLGWVVGGEPQGGRRESFKKPSRLCNDEVLSLYIEHQKDNPDFMERMKNEIKMAEKDPKQFRRLVKHIAKKT